MSIQEKNYVTYEEFGAKGDSVTDDFRAIYNTHVYANEHGLSVLGNSGKVYYIGESSWGISVPVRCDVDFGGATFIIDDSKLPPHTGKCGSVIFDVKPSPECEVQRLSTEELIGKSIKEGATNIGIKLPSDSLVTVYNGDETIFIRHGANKGTNQKSEMLIVDKDGNIDSSTPLMWDYKRITALEVRPLNEKPVTIKNGTFVTVSNKLWQFTEEEKAEGWLEGNQYYYYNRGICISRSNTTVSNITHIIRGEEDTGGYPYGGFLAVQRCCNVLVKDCKLTSHRIYLENRPDGNGTNMGSYDMNATGAIGVTWRNVTQLNDITDLRYWGIMFSSFSRNMTYDGCVLSRFDAHQGAWGVTVKNTTLGHSFFLVGGGELLVENVKKIGGFYGFHFINLRGDYGSTWRGNITIKNCEMIGHGRTGELSVICGSWVNWNFGYPCYMPENIVIENFKSDAQRINLVVYGGKTDGAFDNSEENKNPLIPTKTVTVKGVDKPIYFTRDESPINGIFESGRVKVDGELL